jgi:hypothetical protein
MMTLMLFLFVAMGGGGIGFVAGRVWEIRSGMQSQLIKYERHSTSPDELLTPSEPQMGF